MWVVWLLAVCIGGGNVVKNIFNSGLAVRTGSAILGTLSSFTGAAIILLVLDLIGIGRTLETRKWSQIYCGRRGNTKMGRATCCSITSARYNSVSVADPAANTTRDPNAIAPHPKKIGESVRCWQLWGGGALGVISLGCQTAALAHLGTTLLHVIQVTVELSSSLIIDHIGFLGTPRRPLSTRRAGGVALALLGAVLNAFAFLEKPSVQGWMLTFYLVVALMSGATRPMQACVNGTLKPHTRSKVRVTMVSMNAGTLLLTILLLGQLALQSEFRNALPAAIISTVQQSPPSSPSLLLSQLSSMITTLMPSSSSIQPCAWVWFGGPFSALSVWGGITLAPIVSVSGFFLCIMLGQLVCALLADTFGFLTVIQQPLSVSRVMGVVLVFVGAIFVRTDGEMGRAGDASSERLGGEEETRSDIGNSRIMSKQTSTTAKYRI